MKMGMRGYRLGVLVFCLFAMLLGGCGSLMHPRNMVSSDGGEMDYLITRNNALVERGMNKSSEELLELSRIEERLFALKPTCDVNIYNIFAHHANAGRYDQAALWSERLYALLLKEGVVRCGHGLTKTALETATYYNILGNDEKALLFAQRAYKHAQEIGDDQPDCALEGAGSYTHDDKKVRAEAKELLDTLNSIPLKPNPLTVMASGPASKKYINSIGQEFIYIPPGSFTMGNGKASDNPSHTINLTNGYYLQKTEVTQEQWQEIMGSAPSEFKGRNNPVEEVSWEDVQKFIEKLNEKEETSAYRLPTEAEWEYAARAGTDTDYFFGNDETMLAQYAWFSSNSGGRTHPVATRHPNQWGLYDMHGNVWEWVQDWYDENYYKSSPHDNPPGPESGSGRVFRGGGWGGDAGYLRASDRGGGTPADGYDDLGFRLARTP